MIAMTFNEVKECMSKLLLSEMFDPFYFIEGEITTFNTFKIDGYLKKEFFEKDDTPSRNFALWKEVREFCFSLIKGKRTPLNFQFVLGLSDYNIEKLLSQQGLPFQSGDVAGLYLNIKFDGHALQCTTGTAMNLFTMDKSLEHAWDQMVQRFFSQKGISYELF